MEGPPLVYVMVRDGLRVERPVTLVVTTGDGMIKRMESFESRDEAFAVAGASTASRPDA